MRTSRKSSVRVIVRSACDEPAALLALSVGPSGWVEVVGERARRSIRVPSEDVFSWDEEMYASLRQAFDDGDRGKTVSLWLSLVADEKACNRYQDVLASRHAEEEAQVPDPVGAQACKPE